MSNIIHGSTTVIRSEAVARREQEFTETFVSKFLLPEKVMRARQRNRKAVMVPVDQLERLLQRAGVLS